jgi:hypothetical protein
LEREGDAAPAAPIEQTQPSPMWTSPE